MSSLTIPHQHVPPNHLGFTHQFFRAAVNAISPRQKALALGLAVVPSYLRARLSPEISSWADEPMPRRWTSLLNITNLTKDTYSPARQRFLAFWRRVAWELVERGEKLVAVAGLVNFLIFLYNGRYACNPNSSGLIQLSPIECFAVTDADVGSHVARRYRTLTERIAKMRLVYDKAQLAPNVSFEFLNRQLVWEAFTEFLLFLLPILPLARLRVLLARRLAASRAATSSLARLVPRPVLGLLGLAPPPPRSADAKPKQGPFHGLDKGLCAICMARDYPEDGASRPVAGEPRAQLAYRADCEEGCEYCYWCLGMELGKAEEVGESWECLRCCGEVRRMERVKGEVVVVTEEAGEVDSAAEEGEESEAEA